MPGIAIESPNTYAEAHELPHLTAALEQGGVREFRDAPHFEQGLEWLIAGFEASLKPRRGRGARPRARRA